MIWRERLICKLKHLDRSRRSFLKDEFLVILGEGKDQYTRALKYAGPSFGSK